MAETGQESAGVTHVDFKAKTVIDTPAPVEEIRHEHQHREPVKRQLTKRQKFMHRLALPLGFIIGAGALTHFGLEARKSSQENELTNKQAALEMVLEKDIEPTEVIQRVTLLEGARFRDKPSTKDSTYVTFSSLSEINGVPINGAEGVSISYATIVEGKSPDFEPLDDYDIANQTDAARGVSDWIKVEMKSAIGQEKIGYVSISDQTKEVVIVKDGKKFKIQEDENGLRSINRGDITLHENSFNQTTPISQ